MVIEVKVVGSEAGMNGPHLDSGVARGGEGDFKRVHDSIEPPVWSRRSIAKFV